MKSTHENWTVLRGSTSTPSSCSGQTADLLPASSQRATARGCERTDMAVDDVRLDAEHARLALHRAGQILRVDARRAASARCPPWRGLVREQTKRFQLFQARLREGRATRPRARHGYWSSAVHSAPGNTLRTPQDARLPRLCRRRDRPVRERCGCSADVQRAWTASEAAAHQRWPCASAAHARSVDADAAQREIVFAATDGDEGDICPDLNVHCVNSDGKNVGDLGKKACRRSRNALTSQPFCRSGIRCNQCHIKRNTSVLHVAIDAD